MDLSPRSSQSADRCMNGKITDKHAKCSREVSDICCRVLERRKPYHLLGRLRKTFKGGMIFMLGLDAFIGVCQVESRLKE